LLKNNNEPKIIERKKFHLSNNSYEVRNNLYFNIIILCSGTDESIPIYVYTPDDLIIIKLPLLGSLPDNSLGLNTFFCGAIVF